MAISKKTNRQKINIIRPLINFIKAVFYLLLGRTVKKNCNLEDYGYDKQRMQEECYQFIVPRCKVNLKTLR